ncbi:hypothetical protein BDZ97DRAFT_1808380 [Flammula alnicola]|nr:hypothetical protein BDZ97DRAFT_1808380 [Flammula alnicola]
MVFPFTFNFSVPGSINPFAAPPPISKPEQERRTYQTPADRQHRSQALPRHMPPQEPAPAYPTAYPTLHPIPIPSSGGGLRRISRADLPKINRPRPSPSPSPAPISRKRGWEPDPSPNWSTTSLTLASTSGYLDTPAKYREMAAANANSQAYGVGGNEDITMSDEHQLRYNDNRHAEEDMPPLKKRRGLVGSIISTAVSAALIGTAVGLTVYRLWRDRGKDAQIQAPLAQHNELPDPASQPPPPPYQENEWRPLEQPAAIRVAPPTPRSAAKKRRPATTAPKRPVVYHATRRSRPIPVASAPPVQPEFDFGREEEERVQSVVEDKMDWIGDKLSMLIEQGKRALNTEVVVMSDAKEDEVDDGTGSWEEDDDNDDEFASRRHQGRSRAREAPGSGPASRAGSVHSSSTKRAKKPRNIVPSPSGVGLGLYGVNASSSGSLSASPRQAGFYRHGPSTPSTSTTYASASAGFAPSSAPALLFGDGPHKIHVRGVSYESALPSSSSVLGGGEEDPAGWESPELRESMERARARLLARRAGV